MGNPQDDALLVFPDKPEGTFSAIGTYSALKWLLQSNYGALSAGTFTLATGITDTRWLTLAHVEDRFGAGTVTRKIVRLQDCWIHKLGLEWSATESKYLLLRAAYAGRKVLVQAQNAGGITFPTAPMQPSDRSLYPIANTILRRTDGRLTYYYRIRNLRVTFDQGLGMDWDMGSDMWSVYKAGSLMAELEFTADWCDETWALVDLARAGTKSTYFLSSQSEDGTTLRVFLQGVVLKVSPESLAGQTHSPFHAKGYATQVGSDFVQVDLY